MNESILKQLKESIEIKDRLTEQVELIASIANIAVRTLKNGGKIVLFGNGGSAADAQHIAAELAGKLDRVRPGLPAIALTTNTSVITAISNDFSFDEVFAKQVEALVTDKDLAIGISTGGFSKNVLRAIEEAKKKGAKTVGLVGKSGGDLATMVDIALVVQSQNTQRIQEAHITIGHIVCSLIEDQMFPS